MMKRLLFAVALIFLISCTHQIKFVHFDNGTTINGTYNTLIKSVKVTLPSGDILEGQYVPLENVSIGMGSLFYGSSMLSSWSMGAGGSANGYALLTDGKGIVMEIIFQYSQWTGHGFGEARTNKGAVYKVIF